MGQLHILFLPMMAHGHMIPTLDMAKLFTSKGLKTTIISTPAFADPIEKAQNSGFINIGLKIIKFPPKQSDLPDHIMSLDQATSNDLLPKFFKALSLLQEPVDKLIQEIYPNCLISDMFLPWTVNSAAKFGIPRLVFHGISYLSLCSIEQMRRFKPFNNVSSDSEQFVLPDLPHELKFVRTQVAKYLLEENKMTDFMERVRDADLRSYGVVVNSFYEMEHDYADYYKNVLGRKAWNIGPLLLCNNRGDKVERGKKSSIDAHECLTWLDSKKPNSVVYMCFGSMVNFTQSQLHEIANGLEISSHDFIWVVRKSENEEFLPKGFLERTKGRGLIIRGWAPQVSILDHAAIGAFVTHCGWNSILEGVCAGVPMVTWPLFAEQFFNEKLVTEVLRIGVSVGNKMWQRVANEGVDREAVAKAVEIVMVGELASEMRNRVKCYKEMARKAVEEGGSSYNDLSALIEDLSAYSPSRNNVVQDI
ncbi:hypothetical protein DH2020_044844 [Rehmannia glutinosa]|uniref:Glycosyltransferase n=1 Tax=Rehmannia glutinosa TaxID=99300 RepID=A0ABR0UFV0_REHGL